MNAKKNIGTICALLILYVLESAGSTASAGTTGISGSSDCKRSTLLSNSTGISQVISHHIINRNLPAFTELSAEYSRQYDFLLETAVEDFAAVLSVEEQAAQLFHVSFPNKEYLFRKGDSPAAGGFLFFGFNIPATAEELIDQNARIRNYYNEKGQIPPFYSLDCEGGYVNRLSTVAGRIPSPAAISSSLSPSVSFSYHTAVAQMIAAALFDVNLAPVIESANDSNVNFLGSRTYGSAEAVEQYAGDFITAMVQNGVYPVVKHYPGNTDADPHLGLPVLQITEETYHQEYLQLFERFLQKYPVGVLAAHTVVPCINETPVCLSQVHLQQLRRSGPTSCSTSTASPDDLLIFSDDLLMKALTKNGYPPAESVIAAVKAGVDVVMFSVSQWEEYLDILLEAAEQDVYLKDRIWESCCRILRWKCRQGLLSVNCMNDGGSLKMTVSLMPSMNDSELAAYCADSVDTFTAAKQKADALYWRYF